MEYPLYLFLWFLFPWISSTIAERKNRSSTGWFLIGLFFGPFGFIVATLPKLVATPIVGRRLKDVEYYAKKGLSAKTIAGILILDEDAVKSACLRLLKEKKITEDECRKVVGAGVLGKKCPFCAEYIKEEAIVCRYCGRDL